MNMSRDGRRRRVHRWAAAAIAVAVSSLFAPMRIDAAKTEIKVEYDKMFSFAGLRTWTWRPGGAGDVRLAVSSQDDPERVASRVNPVIVPAIEKEMTGRGFARAAEGSGADLYVHYYALATVGQSSQSMGQFLAPVTQWGVPPFATVTTSLEIYPVGTLIIDVMSTAAAKIVWRGAAQRTIEIERPDDERRKVLEQAIRDVLRRFPPKK
jgi:hypothetical protein